MSKIVIDPGHGGYDNGAMNGNRKEKDDNLRNGLALANKLRDMGYEVIMTRDTDTFIPLIERSNISNRNDVDLFISLHRNAHENKNANGVENFIFTSATPLEEQYATNVLKNVANVSSSDNQKFVDRGVSNANFSVLRNTKAPSMLLELGFITNDNDNNILDNNFDNYITAIAEGIKESLEQTNKQFSSVQLSENKIRELQNDLNNLYRANLVVNGQYDGQLKNAIIKGIQTELNKRGANLNVDGIYGNATKDNMINLKIGAKNNLVYLLQALLNLHNYLIDLDGIFGYDTLTAVRNFQQHVGLPVDGIAGPLTFDRLISNNYYY